MHRCCMLLPRNEMGSTWLGSVAKQCGQNLLRVDQMKEFVNVRITAMLTSSYCYHRNSEKLQCTCFGYIWEENRKFHRFLVKLDHSM